MGNKTKIEWTDATWNPWKGCHKVSPGCKNCYMFREYGGRFGHDANVVVRTTPATFNAPLRWAKKGELPAASRVFTCSWSDFFLREADDWRDEAWAIIKATPYTYQILTKRPENIRDSLPDDWGGGYPNVWLGVSVESKEYLHRIEALVRVPAHRRFVSYEPALGPVDFTPYTPVIHWIISGGESGSQNKPIRPANENWFREVRDTCQKFGVAHFHKQHGGTTKIDGAWGGRVLDGATHGEFPEA